MSSPDGSAVAASSTMISPPSQGSVRAGRAGRGEEPDLVDREVALGEDLAHHRADLAGGADDADAAGRCSSSSSSGPAVDDGLASSAPSSNASCTARTAASRSVSRHDHRDADLRGARSCSMLTPASASASKNVADDAGVRAHAGADQRDLADVVVVERSLEADRRAWTFSSAATAVGPSLLGQREGDVGGLLAAAGDVLHDHVDVDLGVGERRGRSAPPPRAGRARRRR